MGRVGIEGLNLEINLEKQSQSPKIKLMPGIKDAKATLCPMSSLWTTDINEYKPYCSEMKSLLLKGILVYMIQLIQGHTVAEIGDR